MMRSRAALAVMAARRSPWLTSRLDRIAIMSTARLTL
jgi:hypothetical protein